MVANHAFEWGKQEANSGDDTLDVLPFVLEDEGKSGVGCLWPFERNFGEGLDCCRPY